MKLTVVTHASPDAEISTSKNKQGVSPDSLISWHSVIICSFFSKLKRSNGSSFCFLKTFPYSIPTADLQRVKFIIDHNQTDAFAAHINGAPRSAEAAPPLNHLSHTWVSVVVGIPFYESNDQSILQSNPPVNHV